MPLPERMKPARVTRKQMKELVSQLNGILDHIDNGMDENNEELKQMMADWNAQVVIPCGFSDFRDFSSWTSALDFTRMALNQEKYLDDFTWTELNDVINFIRKQKVVHLTTAMHSSYWRLISGQTHWISSITLTAGSMMKHCFMLG